MGLTPVRPGSESRWQRGRALLPALLAAAAVASEIGGDAARAWLAWTRDGVADLELWRLATGHVAHLGPSHLVMNVLALGVAWLLVGRNLTASRWLAVTAVTVAVIDAGFWWLSPALEWYVGLSGLLHGLLVAGLVEGLATRRGESLALLALVAAKLAWEQAAGPLPGSAAAAGGAVIVDAHLYGAVGGLLGVGLARLGVSRPRSI